MDKSSLIFGSILFIFSVSTSSMIFRRFIKKVLYEQFVPLIKSTSFSSIAGASKFKHVGIILDQPSLKDTSTYALFLANDEIISQAVKDTESTIHVYIHCTSLQTKQDSLHYTSEVYSKLWDDVVHKDKLGLECFVYSTHTIGTGKGFFANPNIEAIYANAIKHENIISNITSYGLNISTNPNLGSRPIIEDVSRFEIKPGDNKIFYFDLNEPVPVYKKVALGGSFDQLHNGHRKLLTMALSSCSSTIVIGITSDSMLQKKIHAKFIAKYEERKSKVIEFLNELSLVSQASSITLDIQELREPFGPAITDSSIEALAVSSETLPGAIQINQIRNERGMPALDILVIRRTDNAILSSTFIRQRMMDKASTESKCN